MPSAEQTPTEVQVIPTKSGTWHVAVDGTQSRTSHEDRAAAIAAAREAAGARDEQVFDGEGTAVGTVHYDGCRVVLMRVDGSEYAELDPAPGDPTNAQRISITPADSTSEAVNSDG